MAAGTEITKPVDVQTTITGRACTRLKEASVCVDMSKLHNEESLLVRNPKSQTDALEVGKDIKQEQAVFVASTTAEHDSASQTLRRSGHPPRLPKEPVTVQLPKCFSSSKLVVTESSSLVVPEPSHSAPLAVLVERAEFVPALRSGGWADIGRRQHMEDVHVQIDDMSATLGAMSLAGPRAFYGVFDGHGGQGAASYVSEHLLRHVVQDPAFPDEMTAVFRRAFERTDMEFEAAWSAGREADSGTTALTVLISGSSLVVANAGDCRAVLSRRGKALELSRDQKPGSPMERARIEAAGGFVDEDDYLNGQLGVARALGDWHLQGLKVRDHSLRPRGPLTSEPEVREATLTPEDEFLILGCDGLWDVFTSQNAVEYARRKLQEHNDPERCSRELVAEALRRETTDNLTVVTVCFGTKPPPRLTTAWRPGVKRSISVDGLLCIQTHLNRCGPETEG